MSNNKNNAQNKNNKNNVQNNKKTPTNNQFSNANAYPESKAENKQGNK